MRTIAHRESSRGKFREGGEGGKGTEKGREAVKNERTVTGLVGELGIVPARTPGPVAAKCREIVILQSQREFTLAAGEI